MSTTSYLRSQVEPTSLAAGLAVGDVLAIAAFIAAGRQQHIGQPIGDPVGFLDTLAPFLIGWAIAALVGGLYTREAVLTPRRAISWTLPAWVLAVVVGAGLRATPLFTGSAALTFVLVTFVVGGTLLVGWRTLAATVTENRTRP
ncbi:DUF3054 domain-containing protein [Salinibaculum rarum]|uniref:DUF3054 domain-containing protein n=1 Tax=Salinibaculum rarum TaxID=3058903 RepID=UPI00265E905C|nr:DUF3054 domain-containing protein [Salinibaculum sp. KK48]